MCFAFAMAMWTCFIWRALVSKTQAVPFALVVIYCLRDNTHVKHGHHL